MLSKEFKDQDEQHRSRWTTQIKMNNTDQDELTQINNTLLNHIWHFMISPQIKYFPHTHTSGYNTQQHTPSHYNMSHSNTYPYNIV